MWRVPVREHHLKKGIETTIRHWIPEVVSVQAIGEAPRGDPRARIR
jgi:hypothetical protein